MSEILFADDDADMREMVSDALRAAGHSVHAVGDGEAALRALRDRIPELVILDYRMGTPDGLEVCRRIKDAPRTEHLPVLILTGEAGVDDRVAGFDAGANDYLPKPFDPRELLGRVSALLRLARQGLDRNPTSGLPGGGAIQREVARRREAGEPLALCYLDLNHFKPFSERFGFHAADQLIEDLGALLSDLADQANAFAGHVGGDDFVLLCRPAQARGLAEQAQRRFHERLTDHVPAPVLEAGEYEGEDRSGERRRFPLTALAAAIVPLPPDQELDFADLGQHIARLKREAKLSPDGIAEAE